MKIIDGFTGEFFFLSNLYPARVVYDSVRYKSAENAYCSTMARSNLEKVLIGSLPPRALPHLAPYLELSEGWKETRIGVMKEILRSKFSSLSMRYRLLSTGDSILLCKSSVVEQELWCSKPVGVSNCLGKLLMDLRGHYKKLEKQSMATRSLVFDTELELCTSGASETSRRISSRVFNCLGIGASPDPLIRETIVLGSWYGPNGSKLECICTRPKLTTCTVSFFNSNIDYVRSLTARVSEGMTGKLNDSPGNPIIEKRGSRVRLMGKIGQFVYDESGSASATITGIQLANCRLRYVLRTADGVIYYFNHTTHTNSLLRRYVSASSILASGSLDLHPEVFRDQVYKLTATKTGFLRYMGNEDEYFPLLTRLVEGISDMVVDTPLLEVLESLEFVTRA